MAQNDSTFTNLQRAIQELGYPVWYQQYLIENGIESPEILHAVIEHRETHHFDRIPVGHLLMIHQKVSQSMQSENISPNSDPITLFQSATRILKQCVQSYSTGKSNEYQDELRQILREIRNIEHEVKCIQRRKDQMRESSDSASDRCSTTDSGSTTDVDCQSASDFKPDDESPSGSETDIDPTTGRVAVTEGNDPLRCSVTLEPVNEPWTSRECGHIFEKRVVLNYMRYKENNAEQALCPVSGCTANLILDANAESLRDESAIAKGVRNELLDCNTSSTAIPQRKIKRERFLDDGDTLPSKYCCTESRSRPKKVHSLNDIPRITPSIYYRRSASAAQRRLSWVEWTCGSCTYYNVYRKHNRNKDLCQMCHAQRKANVEQGM